MTVLVNGYIPYRPVSFCHYLTYLYYAYIYLVLFISSTKKCYSGKVKKACFCQKQPVKKSTVSVIHNYNSIGFQTAGFLVQTVAPEHQDKSFTPITSWRFHSKPEDSRGSFSVHQLLTSCPQVICIIHTKADCTWNNKTQNPDLYNLARTMILLQ